MKLSKEQEEKLKELEKEIKSLIEQRKREMEEQPPAKVIIGLAKALHKKRLKELGLETLILLPSLKCTSE